MNMEPKNEETLMGDVSAQTNENLNSHEVFQITEKEHDLTKQHDKILTEIKTSMLRVTAVAIFVALGYTLRCNILVLYMRTFYDNTSLISIIMFMSCMFAGFDSLIQSFIADHWRFDTLIVISAFFDIITYSFEAGAWNFTVISAAYIISGQPIQGLSNAYVTRMLPVTYSKRQIGLYYQLFTVGYIFGPSIGGMLFILLLFVVQYTECLFLHQSDFFVQG